MKLKQAKQIADEIVAKLQPHCAKIEIAGSIRREKPEVKDIEIVAIPHPYDTGLFESGIATVVNTWRKEKGELPCKYTQRAIPYDDLGMSNEYGTAFRIVNLDLFFATANNWGLIFAIRTGSADFSHNVLAKRWVQLGYKSVNGMLTRDGENIPVETERELFDILALKWIEPYLRN